MMEQDESTDFKKLRAGFEGENGLRIQTKPLVPDKPKSIPPPSKLSNPLVSSINAAVKKGTLHAPRVVFRDDKKLNHQVSQPLEVKTKENQSVNNTELDINQKKDVDGIKKKLKEKNLPLVLPVTPKDGEMSPQTPVSEIPIKWSTPQKFVLNPPKSTRDDGEETSHTTKAKSSKKSMKERNLPLVLPVALKKSESSNSDTNQLIPLSIPPSTPKSFVFTPQKASSPEKEKVDTLKLDDPTKKSLKDRNLPLVLPQKTETIELKSASMSPIRVSTPKSFIFDSPKPSKDDNKRTDAAVTSCTASATKFSTSADSSKSTDPTIEVVHISPKPVVPFQTSEKASPVPNFPAPSIPPPAFDSFSRSQQRSPEPTIPAHNIPTQAFPKSSKPETSSLTSETEPIKPNVSMLNLTEVFPPPEGSPPPDFTDIPPPIFEDFPDRDFSEHNLSTSSDNSVEAPAISREASKPTPVVHPVPSPEVRIIPTPVETMLENVKHSTESPTGNKEDQTSTRPLSALSMLARAEEMASVKRTPLDNRVFNLLERAKRKTAQIQKTATPEHAGAEETATPQKPEPETSTPLCEGDKPVVTQPDGPQAGKTLPQLATNVDALNIKAPSVQEVLDTPDLPPVDYVDSARLTPKAQTPEPAKVNGLDHRVLTVVKPLHPPPPPPRKALPATPIVEPQLEKGNQFTPRDSQIPTTPLERFETQDSLHNSSFGEVFYEDAEEPEDSSVLTFRPPSAPSSTSSPRMRMSVHEEAFLKQISLKHQMNDMLPNTEDVDYGSLNSSSPNPELQAIAQSSPALSPSGTLEIGESIFEDHTDTKKGKTVKNKKQKGPPKNPYADTPTLVTEAPKKSLFSRKNSGKAVDDKELKKKEKQREKEKEKEEREKKEREKKEQKEREKKENEMRKTFKISGKEEEIYQVKVIEDWKPRKNDLLVKVGDTVSIIRTENCPKGKWLAKDSSSTYGYIPVKSVDLNINGILELGKKATVSSRSSGNGLRDTEAHSTNSRTSDHYGLNHESFSEDSEEWTCDDDDPEFCTDGNADVGLDKPELAAAQDPVQNIQTISNHTNIQAKQEALHRLSTFFMQPKAPSQPQDNYAIASRSSEPKPVHEADPASLHKEGSEVSDIQILPPPDLYADILVEDSRPVQTKPIKLIPK